MRVRRRRARCVPARRPCSHLQRPAAPPAPRRAPVAAFGGRLNPPETMALS
jgi:hypothetical protein